MKALVTGGHGFIGSHIVDKLREADLEVVAEGSIWAGGNRMADTENGAGKLAARHEPAQRRDMRPLAVAFEPGLDRPVKDRGQRRRIGTHGRSLAKKREVSGTNRAQRGSPVIRAGPTPASTPARPG